MDLSKAISNQSDNSLKLALHILSKPSNVVFSPMSIHVLLGMIAAGSNNPARDQIVGFVTSTSSEELSAFFSEIVTPLHADGGPLGGPVLSSANGVWVDLSLTLKPSFQHVVQKVNRAVSERVDFQNKAKEVVDQVNEWGSKETNGLIKDIIPSGAFNCTTRLVLANAVYFKGKWKLGHKFVASSTQERDFFLLNGKSVRAPLMRSYNDQYFAAFDGFKVVRLPYEHGQDSRRFSMYIYLPDAKDGLPALRERVCSEPGFINSHLPPLYKKSLVKFLVPKFKLHFEVEASDVVKNMGLVLPFKGGALTEIAEYSPFPLEVSRILHKAFIEVNEEGTEAAAVTVAIMPPGCGMIMPEEIQRLEFVADHPFMFVIREDTKGIVLFIGQLLNPLA